MKALEHPDTATGGNLAANRFSPRGGVKRKGGKRKRKLE